MRRRMVAPRRGGVFINYLICFVNLFFVPAVSLAIFCRRGNCPRSFCLDTLLWYALFVVADLVAARVLAVLLRMGIVPIDGRWYTVLAAVCAVAVALCADFLSKSAELLRAEDEETWE